MRVLVKDTWQDGFLDQAVMQNMVRVRPITWITLASISNAYYVRQKSLRMVFNYIKQIGVINVGRKIISRLREAIRNDKYISCGYGVTDNNEYVYFIAPMNPKCMERVVLHASLVSVATPVATNKDALNNIDYFDLTQHATTNKWWEEINGWSEFSGVVIAPEKLQQMFQQVAIELEAVKQAPRQLPYEHKIVERIYGKATNSEQRKTAVLFGLGNSAKTRIIPNIKPYLHLAMIHECDVAQIHQQARDEAFGYDTAALPADDAQYDAYFIAGYHHTHAELAAVALSKGAYAVIEKPLATTQQDFALVLAALNNHPGKAFVCYQRRHLPFNDYIYQDLKVKKGEPLDYHCIVYEEPLPKLHWYCWPNSGSRIISNACHWIDHFLFLNAYSPVVKYKLEVSANDSMFPYIELANGATFSMALTEIGSNRIGVHELIDVRTRGAQARIINSTHYTAENSIKIIRRTKIDKLAVFTTMYQDIAKKITAGAEGDSMESIMLTSSLVLELDKLYQQQTGIKS